MTVLGVIVEPDRAVMWCDSETYRDDRPAGHAAKMSSNPLAGVIIGGGNLALIRQGARSLQSCASIDAVERRLPNDLRLKAARLAPDLTLDDPFWCPTQVILAVGYSQAAGRIVGWQFSGASLFEPTLLSRFGSPTDADLQTAIVPTTNIRDIIGIARRQLEMVRRRIPEATGGSLSVAEITEAGQYFCRIPDFALTAEAPVLATAVAEAAP